jgi:hypothetical protein
MSPVGLLTVIELAPARSATFPSPNLLRCGVVPPDSYRRTFRAGRVSV